MRYLILIASLALAGNALADEKPKTVARELDKSTPLLMKTEATPDAADASGADQRSVVSPRDAASGMASGKRTQAPPAEGADYNSSRSNKTHGVASAGGGGSSSSGGTRAQDYNSSRSNTTTVRDDKAGDLDSERDSALREVTCSMASDDCVEYQDGEDPVLRKRPGK